MTRTLIALFLLLMSTLVMPAFAQESNPPLVFVGTPHGPAVPKVMAAFHKAVDAKTGGDDVRFRPGPPGNVVPHRQQLVACQSDGKGGCLNDFVGQPYRQPGNLLVVMPDTVTELTCPTNTAYTPKQVAEQVRNDKEEGTFAYNVLVDINSAEGPRTSFEEQTLPCVDGRIPVETLVDYHLLLTEYESLRVDVDNRLSVPERTAAAMAQLEVTARPHFMNLLHINPDVDVGKRLPGIQAAHGQARIDYLNEQADGPDYSVVTLRMLGNLDELTVNGMPYQEGQHLHPGVHVIQWNYQGDIFTRVLRVADEGVNREVLLVSGDAWAKAMLTHVDQRGPEETFVVESSLQVLREQGYSYVGLVDWQESPPRAFLYNTSEVIPSSVDMPALDVKTDEQTTQRATAKGGLKAVDEVPGQPSILVVGDFMAYGIPFGGAGVDMSMNIVGGFGFQIGVRANITKPGMLLSPQGGVHLRLRVTERLEAVILAQLVVDVDARTTATPRFGGMGGGGVRLWHPAGVVALNATVLGGASGVGSSTTLPRLTVEAGVVIRPPIKK